MNSFARHIRDHLYISRLLQWRWMVLIIAIPISLVIELVEGPTNRFQILDEVIIDGLFLPISTWIVLTFVARRLSLHFAHTQSLEQRQSFAQRIAELRDLQDLTRFIVHYPATLMPVERVALLIHEPGQRELKPVAEWQDDRARPPDQTSSARSTENRFVLLVDNTQVGLLIVQWQTTNPPTASQIALLGSLVPEMAQALVRARNDAAQQEKLFRAAQAYERRRLTQELHDSLAQQVFYLHLGLDQLCDGEVSLKQAAIQQKLLSMRDVAADVYEQIRNNLSMLRAWEQVNITEAISELARVTAHNEDLAINISVEGRPEWLSPHTSENVYSIVREALNNVVKHAGAQQVELALHWSAEYLSIALADDGTGFDMAAVPPHGHYGLILMRETIDALGGTFVIDSQAGAGTRLHISIPLRRDGAYPLHKLLQRDGLQPALYDSP